MATVQIADFRKYIRAIGLLYEIGQLFRTKPIRQIVVGPYQLQVLRQAGLLSDRNGAKKRSKSVRGAT